MKKAICDIQMKKVKVSVTKDYITLTFKKQKENPIVFTLPKTTINLKFVDTVRHSEIVSNHYKILVDDFIQSMIQKLEMCIFVHNNEFYTINYDNEIQLLSQMFFNVKDTEIIHINGNGLDFTLSNLALSSDKEHKMILDESCFSLEKGIYWSQREHKFFVTLYDRGNNKAIMKKFKELDKAQDYKNKIIAELIK